MPISTEPRPWRCGNPGLSWYPFHFVFATLHPNATFHTMSFVDKLDLQLEDQSEY